MQIITGYVWALDAFRVGITRKAFFFNWVRNGRLLGIRNSLTLLRWLIALRIETPDANEFR